MSDKQSDMIPSNLKLSISNLWDKLGSTDTPLVGLAINLSLAATGVAVALLFSNPVVSTVGAAWAILNLFGPIKWVFGV